MAFENTMVNIAGTTLFRHIHTDTLCSPFTSGELRHDGLILQDKNSHHYFMLGGKTLVKLLEAFRIRDAEGLRYLGSSLKHALNEAVAYGLDELGISSINSFAEAAMDIVEEDDYLVFEWDFTGVDCFVSPALMLKTYGIPGGSMHLRDNFSTGEACRDPRKTMGTETGKPQPYMSANYHSRMMIFLPETNRIRRESHGHPVNVYYGPEAIPDGVAISRMGFMATYAEGDKTWQQIYDVNVEAVEHKSESEVQERLALATTAFWQIAGKPEDSIAHPLILVPRANEGWMFHQQVYSGPPTINKTTPHDLLELTPEADKNITAARQIADYQVVHDIAQDVQIHVDALGLVPAVKERFTKQLGSYQRRFQGRLVPNFYLLGSSRLLIPIVLPQVQVGYSSDDTGLHSSHKVEITTPYGQSFNASTVRAAVPEEHRPKLFLFGSASYQPGNQIIPTVDGIDDQPLAKIFGTGSRVSIAATGDKVLVEYSEPEHSVGSTDLMLAGMGRLRETYSSREYMYEVDDTGALTENSLYSNEQASQATYNTCFPVGLSPLDYAMPNMKKAVNVFWFAMDKYAGFTDTHVDIMSGGKVRGSAKFIAPVWHPSSGESEISLVFSPGDIRKASKRILEWAAHVNSGEFGPGLLLDRYQLWSEMPSVGGDQ